MAYTLSEDLKDELVGINVTIILGTTRPANKSQRVAKFLNERLSQVDEVKVRQVSPADYDLRLDGNDEENKIAEYTEIVNQTDAFVIVAPEYNHGYPGSLKSLLDKELLAYNHRVAALVGVSKGLIAGARVVEALLPVMRELGLITSHTSLNIPRVQDNFDEDGKTKDEQIIESTERFIKELLWMARVMKEAREETEV